MDFSQPPSHFSLTSSFIINFLTPKVFFGLNWFSSSLVMDFSKLGRTRGWTFLDIFFLVKFNKVFFPHGPSKTIPLCFFTSKVISQNWFTRKFARVIFFHYFFKVCSLVYVSSFLGHFTKLIRNKLPRLFFPLWFSSYLVVIFPSLKQERTRSFLNKFLILEFNKDSSLIFFPRLFPYCVFFAFKLISQSWARGKFRRGFLSNWFLSV